MGRTVCLDSLIIIPLLSLVYPSAFFSSQKLQICTCIKGSLPACRFDGQLYLGTRYGSLHVCVCLPFDVRNCLESDTEVNPRDPNRAKQHVTFPDVHITPVVDRNQTLGPSRSL